MRTIKVNQDEKGSPTKAHDKYSNDTYKWLTVTRDIISMSLWMSSNEESFIRMVESFGIKVSIPKTFIRVYANGVY